MVLHFNIKVYGRVQGVFFRVSTQREAARIGLTGFVRNEPDRSVYIEAEGAQEQLDRLLTWIELGGPPQGEVSECKCEEGEVRAFKGFDIR